MIWIFLISIKLDLESIMSSLRIDLEKEWISIGMDLDWDLKILNFEFYDFKNFDSKRYSDFEYWNEFGLGTSI